MGRSARRAALGGAAPASSAPATAPTTPATALCRRAIWRTVRRNPSGTIGRPVGFSAVSVIGGLEAGQGVTGTLRPRIPCCIAGRRRTFGMSLSAATPPAPATAPTLARPIRPSNING